MRDTAPAPVSFDLRQTDSGTQEAEESRSAASGDGSAGQGVGSRLIGAPAAPSGGRTPTVLYVHHRPELGGAPTSLYLLLRSLDRARFRPVVLCPGGEAGKLFNSAGVPVHVGPISTFTHVVTCEYRGLRWSLLAREWLRAVPHALTVARLVRREKAAIVHLNEGNLLLAALIAKLSGVRVVSHFRGMLAQGHWGLRRRFVQAWLARCADCVIAIDSGVAGPLAGLSHLETISNGVDMELFRFADGSRVRQELDIPSDALVVGMVGRVRQDEGSLNFLHAAAGLQARFPDAWFLLVGGGTRPPAFFRTIPGRLMVAAGIIRDDLAEAEALASSLGLRNVRFVPFRHDVPAVYAALNVVVSGGEAGIGRQALEAAAAGRPIVAASRRPAPDLVREGETGYVVPPGDPAALRERIETLLADEGRRSAMGRMARALAEHRFDPADNARRVMSIYDRLLDRGSL